MGTVTLREDGAPSVAARADVPGKAHGRLLTLVLMARLIAGGMYVAGGLVPFLHWVDLPIPNPEAGQFMAALVESDMLKLSKSMEVVFGLALLFNLWVPLSLAMLSPVLVFILWMDLYLDPFPLYVVAVSLLGGCHLFLMYVHRDCYRPMFVRRVNL